MIICCSATVGELRTEQRIGGNPLARFQDYLRGQAIRSFFQKFCVKHDRFEEAFEPSTMLHDFQKNVLDEKSVESSQTVAIVFHGAPAPKLADILENGINPFARSGRYFCTVPSVCAIYCKGSMTMLPYLVVIPRNRDPGLSCNFVVVKDNHHKFLLGIIHLTAANSPATKPADREQSSHDQTKKRKSDEEICIFRKIRILRLLIQGKICFHKQLVGDTASTDTISTDSTIEYSKLQSCTVEFLKPNAVQHPAHRSA